MLVAWNEDLASGDPLVAAGQGLVIEAINRLNDCTGADADRDVVATVFSMLQAHLPGQFQHEERRLAHSKQLPAHRAEHNCFLAALKALSIAFGKGENVANLLLLNLVAFLKGHMQSMDCAEFGQPWRRAA